MDWASRHVLAWRLSNTLEAGFCVEALDEALTRHGQPEVFNTDPGSQFTGFAFSGRLQAAGVRISMDGRGRCLDNIFIERLWRSLKYEAVYLHELTDGFEVRRLIDEWIGSYNGTVKLSRICPFCGRILLDQRLRINDLAVAAGGENAAKLLNLTVPP